MAEIITLTQRATVSISLGESHFREFKTALEGKPGKKRPRNPTAICKEIGEALVAFANADGGELFIGVEDDGTITGLQHNQEDIETMLNAVHTHILDSECLPLQICTSITISDKQILFFSVTKSTEKIFQLPDGRCMRRLDKCTIPACIDSLFFERRESISRAFDRAFIDNVAVSDLDLALVQQLADNLLRGMSPEQYLQQLNLAEYGIGGIRLKRAAVLLFAKDIVKWFPYSQIRIVKVNGDQIMVGEKYNVISDDYMTGNIFQLLSVAWERLRPYLSQKTVFSGEATFEQTFVYPENACREALINALAHRDYSISNPTTIYIFDNRLSFESPGELLSTISIDDIKNCTGVHESRNSNIARVLRENKLMREMGEGIRRIFDLMKEQELAPPQISSAQGRFVISMSHKSIYSERELMWLSLFKEYDLDQYQKRIIIAGIDGRKLSPAIIYAALGSPDRNLYDRSVTMLRISGILSEIRSAGEASVISRRDHRPKQEIERFIVVTPEKINQGVSNKVYVYELPENIDESLLIAAMSIFGDVVNVKLPKDDKTNTPRGFAFVEYRSSNDALRAVAIKKIKIKDSLATIIPYKPYRKKTFHKKTSAKTNE